MYPPHFSGLGLYGPQFSYPNLLADHLMLKSMKHDWIPLEFCKRIWVWSVNFQAIPRLEIGKSETFVVSGLTRILNCTCPIRCFFRMIRLHPEWKILTSQLSSFNWAPRLLPQRWNPTNTKIGPQLPAQLLTSASTPNRLRAWQDTLKDFSGLSPVHCR